MSPFLAAVLLTAAPAQAADQPPAPTCSADATQWRAVAGFFDLAPGQTIGEVQPNFVVTDCLAQLAKPNGRFVALVESGDRIAQVAERIAIGKQFKRDQARYGAVALVQLAPDKAPPAAVAAGLDRVLLVGRAPEMLRDRKKAAGTLRALAALVKPAGLFGVVGVPEGEDVDTLIALARDAGWTLVDRTSTGADGLLLLKFRRG